MLDLLQGIRVVSFNHFLLGPDGDPGVGRSRRRRDRGRDAGGRLAAPLVLGRPLVRRPEHAPALRQPQQALDRARPQVLEGQGDCAEARRHGGRRRGELPPRRDGEARPRPRDAESAQARPDLRLGLGLRAGRPLCRAARPGPPGAGAVRHDGDHRPGRKRAAAGRRLGDRPPRRRAVRTGRARGPRAPRAHRPGLPRRREPDAVRPRPAGRVARRRGSTPPTGRKR